MLSMATLYLDVVVVAVVVVVVVVVCLFVCLFELLVALPLTPLPPVLRRECSRQAG